MSKYLYCVYDTKDNDLIVCVGGTLEIERFLKKSIHDVWQYCKKNSLVYKRYRVEKIRRENG